MALKALPEVSDVLDQFGEALAGAGEANPVPPDGLKSSKKTTDKSQQTQATVGGLPSVGQPAKTSPRVLFAQLGTWCSRSLCRLSARW